ncbi:MAG: (2Fe-2S)-binding protein [Desulfobulbaceae bacterium]|jgi:NADH dehydrogenase/NADH:ubiquinone oxidoreductase subunit G|nr:(2Fe-2S)-binding protein [Desulfobulbaceae bacterium]
MVKLVIDAKKCEVPVGTTALAAAREVGIVIPTLCSLRALRPNKACRLCIVEVQAPGLEKMVAASCDLLVAEGMEISANSAKIQKMRRAIIQLLLAAMPDNIAVKELAAGLGVFATPFAVAKRDACALCGVCIQACQEKIGVSALSYAAQGGKAADAVILDAERCVGCGACANVCPVGALTVQDKNDKRELSLYGETANVIDLVKCQVCGAPFATEKVVDLLRQRLKKDALTLDAVYCPACARERNPAPCFERAAI